MDVTSVSADQVPDDVYVVDVREQDEWDAGHVAGAAHVPMSDFVARQDQVPKDRPVLVVCTVGARSQRVAAYLSELGWQASNLEGGLKAWVAAGKPLVTDTGADPTL